MSIITVWGLMRYPAKAERPSSAHQIIFAQGFAVLPAI
jgi:hypothetical protein